jgi:hypothetical protein
VHINPNSGVPQFVPGINYSDPNIIKLVDSGGWGQDGYIKFPQVTDELKAVRLDVSKDIDSPISKADAGFNYNHREKTRESLEYFVNLPGGTSTYADVPSSCLQSSTYLGYVGFPSILSWDVNCVFANSYVLKPNYNQDITNKDWRVTEKVGTGYVKFDIDTEVAHAAAWQFRCAVCARRPKLDRVCRGQRGRRQRCFAGQRRHQLQQRPARPQPRAEHALRAIPALRRRQGDRTAAPRPDAREHGVLAEHRAGQ